MAKFFNDSPLVGREFNGTTPIASLKAKRAKSLAEINQQGFLLLFLLINLS